MSRLSRLVPIYIDVSGRTTSEEAQNKAADHQTGYSRYEATNDADRQMFIHCTTSD
jgi:hypothetical protein